jgi:hypothetical protein
LTTVYGLEVNMTVTGIPKADGEYDTLTFPTTLSVLGNTKQRPTISHEVVNRLNITRTIDGCYSFNNAIKVKAVDEDELRVEERNHGIDSYRRIMKPRTEAVRAMMGPEAELTDAEHLIFRLTPTAF